jgi:hypothetical protein
LLVFTSSREATSGDLTISAACNVLLPLCFTINAAAALRGLLAHEKESN